MTIDKTCNVRVVTASPELKDHLREEAKRAPQPAFNRFLGDVAANNKVIRELCQ